jgi:hypothetical protein
MKKKTTVVSIPYILHVNGHLAPDNTDRSNVISEEKDDGKETKVGQHAN